jgi:hypothetical protein
MTYQDKGVHKDRRVTTGQGIRPGQHRPETLVGPG